MSNIRIDIASEFKDKGFKKAEKATSGLEGSFKKLGIALVGALSVQKVVQFGKASVKAFAEDEAAARRLSQTLGNMNLAFEDSRIKAFISDLEASSGVLDDQLRPAFQRLLTTTGSVAKAQELLTLALDMSAGSGQDVQTVASDLSKAYVGQARGLTKYSIGLSQTQLKAKSFLEIQQLLSKQFSGQNAAFLDTYAGKVAVLDVAFANVQETVGKGLVDSFILLAGDGGIGAATSAMDKFAQTTSDAIYGVAVLLDKLNTKFGTFGGQSLGKIIYASMGGGFIDALAKIGNDARLKPKPFTTPMSISGATDAQVKIDKARKKAEADAAKRARELLALTKKQVKAQEDLAKKKKEEGILGEIAKRFDLERIQIQAALGNEINTVERLRLELMQAILDEDVKRALLLEGQLINAEAAAQELALLLDKLDEMVDDPFADWPGTINRIKELLSQLKIKVPIETLFAEKGLKLDQEKMTVTKLDRMDVNANVVYVNGQVAGAAGGSSAAAIANTNSMLSDEAAALYRANNPIIIPAVEAHADAMAMLAESELALAEAMLSESNITVNVTVNGTVTSQDDLTTTITNQLYNYQRAGGGLLYSSRAI